MSSSTTTDSSLRTRALRATQALGGLLWLGGLASFVGTDELGPLTFVPLAAGAVLASLGVAGTRWQSFGRAGRTGSILAVVGGLLLALSEWPWVVFGILAVALGTVVMAIGVLLGAGRNGPVGVALLAGGVGAFTILGGPHWLPASFSLAHLAVALAGPGTMGARPGRMLGALAGASAATLAVILLSLAMASGLLRLPGSVSALVRTGPLPALPIVVDTDVHPDDWIALLYLASEPTVEIRAVTVGGGTVGGCEQGVEITRALLADVGRSNVPVACGPPPAPGGLPFPPEWGRSFKEVAASLGWMTGGGPAGTAGTTDADGDAVALLRSAVETGPITIVSLGPATNIARLLEDPTWDRRKVVRIIQMAGAVDVPGNVDALPSVEWNAAVDPAALSSVLSGGLEVILVSLDGTRHVPIRPDDIDRLTADRSTRTADLAARILESQRTAAAGGGYHAWDQLAAVVTCQPDVVQLERMNLRVATGPADAGRTVRDPTGQEVFMTVDADRAGFERILLDALLGRAR